MTATDPFDLERFLVAQDEDDTFARVLDELGWGRKASHWMWFVFPQIAGLGRSETSRRFAISSLAEATAFLRHPVLGPRLVECVDLVASSAAGSAEQIFGAIDAMKLHSSMTLFMRAAPNDFRFRRVLDRYFGGFTDRTTDDLLATR